MRCCPALLLVLVLVLVGVAQAFRICAFNAQRLTLSKVARESVMDPLVRILARCDITVLQELVDASGSALYLLLRELNRFDTSGPYGSLSSPFLGRSTYLEKYVYVYRSHKVQIQEYYVYEDRNDSFIREPFVARFTLPSEELPSLVLIPLHTTPSAVEQELHALYSVFLEASRRWRGEDVILLGDFNADCGALTKRRLEKLALRTKAGFYWAIADGEDTTVRASTHCAYDRIVLHGERCRRLLHAASVFNFPQSFRLTEKEALNVSDHYPVEVELKLRLSPSPSPSPSPSLCPCPNPNSRGHGTQPLSLVALLLSPLLLLLLLSPQRGLGA